MNDDFVFMQEGTKLEVVDLFEGLGSKRTLSQLPSLDSTCKAYRPREAELLAGQTSVDNVILILNCKAKVMVKTADNTDVYTGTSERDMNGEILRVFASTETKQVMILYEDLSVHNIQNGRKKWIREESLS